MSKMIYSDAENERWWRGLSKTDVRELFETIERVTGGNDFYAQLRARYNAGEPLNSRHLAALRKWA